MEVNVHQAKTHLSRLLQRVAGGEEIIIARSGTPIARLVAIENKESVRPLDFARDEVFVAADFDAPLPEEVLSAFYCGEAPDPIKINKRKRK